MNDLPTGTTYIEIPDIYDGTSVYEMPDGTLVNRWPPEDRRHVATQAWIEKMGATDE